ncbi:Rossmann-fold NAD(P)-binding domain-containing protein [Rickettsia canadensis]|uniref:hypothetical protein n=1 Tax=Rickettsia canadensis TaxID=788 RepID=UPI000311A658
MCRIYDVRVATKEQVESLGAKFVSPELQEDLQDKSGYASESSEDYKAKQEEFLAKIIKGYSYYYCTNSGKKHRYLLQKMLELMKYRSVIVDIATSTVGNVEGLEIDKIVTKHGVTIVGLSNLAVKIATGQLKVIC